jgi:teichuronic acid biosynthesis glycosyltransferase TuaC
MTRHPLRALVLTNMYPTGERPALGSVVREQVRELAALGVHSEIVVIRGHQSKATYFTAATSLSRLVRRGDFDLVHAHYGLSGAVAMVQRRLPIVTTFHGSDTGYVPWQRVVSWGVARATTPIFVSRQGAGRLGLPDAVVIPCGVDVERFQPMPRGQARQILGWHQDQPVALFPGGRANRVKRADLFDGAVEHARMSMPDLRSVALENLTRDEVRLVLNAVDVTVMTSESEGSPVTIKESLACETPVVSVDVGDVPDVISGLHACFVVPRDPRAIGAAIVRSIEAGKSHSLRIRAEQLSGPRVAARILDVYRSVVASRR